MRWTYRDRYPDAWPTQYKMGMWVWLAHRLTGVVLVGYLIAHIAIIATSRGGEGGLFDRLMDTFSNRVALAFDLPLIAIVLFHTFNGIRILLFDLGIGVRAQKQIFWAVMGLTVVLFGLTLVFLLPYVLGRSLT